MEREEFQHTVRSIVMFLITCIFILPNWWCVSHACIRNTNDVDKNDADVDRTHPRSGISNARDDNPRTVRHVSQVAQMRETCQNSPTAQKRADPSSGEMDDPSTYFEDACHIVVTDRLSGLRSLLTLVVVRERLPCAVCHRSAWRCATPCYSLARFFQR